MTSDDGPTPQQLNEIAKSSGLEIGTRVIWTNPATASIKQKSYKPEETATVIAFGWSGSQLTVRVRFETLHRDFPLNSQDDISWNQRCVFATALRLAPEDGGDVTDPVNQTLS